MGFNENWPSSIIKNSIPQEEMAKPQEDKKRISIIEFEEALLRRKDILGMGGRGVRPEDRGLVAKHDEKMKTFIEQEKENFLSSLPEKVLGSGQREYTRAELRATAERIFSGEETQVETMTNGGDLRLREKVIRILDMMKRSGLDEYDLVKKNEPPKKAEDWVPYGFSAGK